MQQAVSERHNDTGLGAMDERQDASTTSDSAPMHDICEELIVRMGADPSTAPRSRIAVVFHEVMRKRR